MVLTWQYAVDNIHIKRGRKGVGGGGGGGTGGKHYSGACIMYHECGQKSSQKTKTERTDIKGMILISVVLF